MSRRSEVDEADARGRVDPPIPPKNLSAVQGRTVARAGHERSQDFSTPSLLINNIIISKEDVGLLRPFFAVDSGLRGVLRGETRLLHPFVAIDSGFRRVL